MTTIVPSEVGFDRLQAVFLRGHLRCLAAGMKNSQMSRRDILAKAGAITGKTYKASLFASARLSSARAPMMILTSAACSSSVLGAA